MIQFTEKDGDLIFNVRVVPRASKKRDRRQPRRRIENQNRFTAG